MECTHDHILSLLCQVKDPEIPVLSLVDLGVITRVAIEGESISIDMTPTFVGCPALSVMQDDIREVLRANGFDDVSINVSYRKAWTSDMITEEGRKALKKFGLAPPPSVQLFSDLEILEHAECPRCGGRNTDLRNTFGPTLCRSIHFCNHCQEAFEQFKPI